MQVRYVRNDVVGMNNVRRISLRSKLCSELLIEEFLYRVDACVARGLCDVAGRLDADYFDAVLFVVLEQVAVITRYLCDSVGSAKMPAHDHTLCESARVQKDGVGNEIGRAHV